MPIHTFPKKGWLVVRRMVCETGRSHTRKTATICLVCLVGNFPNSYRHYLGGHLTPRSFPQLFVFEPGGLARFFDGPSSKGARRNNILPSLNDESASFFRRGVIYPSLLWFCNLSETKEEGHNRCHSRYCGFRRIVAIATPDPERPKRTGNEPPQFPLSRVYDFR